MAPFPQTGELTSFDGPAENPLFDSGRWAEYGRDPLRRNGTGTVLPTVEFPPNGMYWTVNAFQGDCEIWGCSTGGGLGAALEGWRIAFWLGSPTSFTGYLSGYGGGIGKNFFLRNYSGGPNSFTDIGGHPNPGYPDKIGLRITASEVEQWGEYSGVWSLIQAVGDTSHRGVFFAAIELEEQGGINEVGWGCFGGGVLNRQHIYRILRAPQLASA